MQNKTIPNQTIQNQTKYYYNGHNLVIFKDRRHKYSMLLHIENDETNLLDNLAARKWLVTTA